MARLHEPAAAPLESLELLRKRFLRQNKEIIKINADQAARIRSLEAETSRLLSENITLREDNIRLNHQVNKGRHALALNNVGVVKDKLQAFASGLSDLLAELSEAQSNLPDPRPYHDTPKRRSPKSPGRQWKSGSNISDLLELDGRLPPIVEGKYYPRKTLDADEIDGVMLQSPILQSPPRPSPGLSDSPALGPPAVVNFDMGDPVKQGLQQPASPSPVKTRVQDSTTKSSDENTRLLSSNLESRKKRRTSTFAGDLDAPLPHMEEKNEHRGDVSSGDAKSNQGMFKTGDKRTFSMREDEDTSQPVRLSMHVSKSMRDTENTLELPIRGTKPKRAHVEKFETEGKLTQQMEKTKKAPQGERRALGEKPVNTDPVVSPAKSRSRQPKHMRKDAAIGDYIKPDLSINTDQPVGPASVNSQRSKPETKASDSKPAKKTSKVEDVFYVEPMTPAPLVSEIPLDAHSATSSAAENASNDTPPPSELGSRPSRRSRPTVSYAEPNLRDKMRRPTKELVDAVSADSRPSRQSMSLEAHAPETDVAIPNWRSKPVEPPSPLATKQDQAGEEHVLPLTVSTERKRRSFVPAPHRSVAEAASDYSVSESKVEKILSNSNRRLSRAREAAGAKTHVEGSEAGYNEMHRKEQDVFDIGSSSPESNRSAHTRIARRVASVPEHLNRNGGQAGGSRRGGAGRRRETMAGDSKYGPKTEEVETEQQVERELTSRSERMATRRRSMML